jgi:hypothetical protein
MSIDFIFWALGLAVFGVGYALGRHHGRKAEQANPSVGVVGPWRPK